MEPSTLKYQDRTGPCSKEVIDWKETFAMLQLSWPKSGFRFDPDPESDWWQVPMVKDFNMKMVLDTLRSFEVGVRVDSRIDKSDPDKGFIHIRSATAFGPYVVKFKKSAEPAREFRGHSFSDLERKFVIGPTLLERMMLGFGLFVTFSENIDVDYKTLCMGTRRIDGRRPRVGYQKGAHSGRGDFIRFDLCRSDHRNKNTSTRPVEFASTRN